MDIKVCTPEKTIPLQAGDVLDFGTGGMIVFYTPEEAVAMRILQQERAKEIQRVIEVTKAKVKDAKMAL